MKNLYFNFPATVELELNGLRFFGKFVVLQRDQQGLKLLAANDSKIFLKYENFVCVSVGTRYKL
jgi:hypothetical protein